MRGTIRNLLAAGMCFCAACGGGGSGGGAPPPGPGPAGSAVVDVTVVDLFGQPMAGRVALSSTGGSNEEASASADGTITFNGLWPGDVGVTATGQDSEAEWVSGSASGRVARDGRLALRIEAGPKAEALTGGTAVVDAVSPDGRSLTVRFSLSYVAGDWRTPNPDRVDVALDVSLADCTPDATNDSVQFQPDCVAGAPGFDAPYQIVAPSGPVWVADAKSLTGTGYRPAVLIDQSKHVADYDPRALRVPASKYFFTRHADVVRFAAFAADDNANGDLSPLPQQPVTVLPRDEHGLPAPETIEALGTNWGGVAPLYTALDRTLDFIWDNTGLVTFADGIVVLTDGHDDTCGSPIECHDLRETVVQKSHDYGVELVAVALPGGSVADRRALSEVIGASRGRALWLADANQLPTVFATLPNVLSSHGDAFDVTFRIEAAAGTFVSGRTVFGTLSFHTCPFDCSDWSMPIAVRIP